MQALSLLFTYHQRRFLGMLTNDVYLEKVRGNFWEFLDSQQELGETFKGHYAATYEDGVISAKHKRLMAMVGALAAGCEGCIMGQCSRALDLGATKEEVLEACAVALSLGGTMAGSKIAMIVQLLKDKGLY